MRKERLSRVRLVDKRFFKVLIVGILLVLSFPKSSFAYPEPTEFCTMTIRSDIHTEKNPAKADGICNGDLLWGYYMPHLDEFALRGTLVYNLKANPNGQVYIVPIPQVDRLIYAELTVYTIKVESPKQEEPKQPPKDEKPTDPPKQENPKEEPKQPQQPQQPPKDEKPKTEQPKNEPPKNQNPKNEQSKNEQPKTEQPKTENPKTQKPNSEQTKNQNSKTDSKGQNTYNERNENIDSKSNKSNDETTENEDTGTETNESENNDEQDNEPEKNESNNGNNGLKEESVFSNKDKNIDQDQIKKDIELSMEPESDKDGSKKSSVWLWLGIINAVVIVGIIGYWWHKKNAY